MKLMPKLSSQTKNTLLGGVAGALTVYMESAANGLVAGYPQILKDRLVTQMPRNGELVAAVAPMGVTWAVAKKKHSERVKDVKTGVMLYDLPKLLDLFAYRIAYIAGLPQVGAGLQFNPRAMPMNIRPLIAANISANKSMSTGTGKYTLKNSSFKTVAPTGGIGKYR